MKYVALLFAIFGITTIIFGIFIRNGMTFKTFFFRANLKSKSKDELVIIGKNIVLTGAIISIISAITYLLIK